MKQAFSHLYGSEASVIQKQIRRYERILKSFQENFGEKEAAFFSAPGRTEIGGNHTDHNNGKVLAAGVNVDAVAAAAKSSENRIVLLSEGYSTPFAVDLNRLDPVIEEKGTASALIRGIAARFKTSKYEIGGFQAYVSSDVLPGSGLSSSAAIEVLIGVILNEFYNSGQIPPGTLAAIGQFAENVYFGKPCGLMDQMASAVGGVVAIDFKRPGRPRVRKIAFDLNAFGYSLLIVNTGGSHADLTRDYASIPSEMKKLARFFGKETLSEITIEAVYQNIRALRAAVGDRSILRALHFFAENARVDAQAQALEKGDLQAFLRLIGQSGNSSWKRLQNCTRAGHPEAQGVALALALTEDFIETTGSGACRVHGGGFAGTIQAFLPKKQVRPYKGMIEKTFGKEAVMNLAIRPAGALCVGSSEFIG
ncbi:MAG TPA: galactokinase [Bacteroidetes bacterium]|nr:galactokinase [Bacteroidota bacterium]